MKMSDDRLLALIEQMERHATGYWGGEVAGEQSKALDYYYRKPFGTEEEGRSQVVSSDVWDVVEGLTPVVLRPFVSSDDVVKFNAIGPEDEEAAQQESDYINFLVTQRNDVFNELVSWVKSGLLQKNGIVKYWWEKSRRVDIERYSGITEDALAMLAQDEGVEIAEHTDNGDGTHDVVLRVSNEAGEAKFCVVPPEEFRISRDATSPNPKQARYVAHITKRTISELREMGYDVPDDVADYESEDPYMSEQYLARRSAEENMTFGENDVDPTMREVVFREAYIRVDRDGDGIAELRRVCVVGREILADEETEEIPFCAWTPYPQPFKFWGKCPADETLDVQLIKSTLWRQSLDNIYTINNNRNFVSNRVNLDDLLDNQIAGVVRVDAEVVGNHVVPAPITPIGGVIQPMIEYMDSAKENRTGFTRYNQGMDASSLNKTATGVRIIAEAGNMRVELIARAFAEQGLKNLMLGIHGLIRRHGSQKDVLRLRGKWVEIDPRSWKRRSDLTVSVGLGTMDKQMQLQGLQMLMAEQKQLMQAGLVKPPNLYNSAAKLAELLGEKSAEKFFADPSQAQPEPPPDPMDDPEMMLKVAESKRKDAELALKERDQDLRERESQLAALSRHAELETKLAGLVDPTELMAQIQALQAQMNAIERPVTAEVVDDIAEPEQEPFEAEEQPMQEPMQDQMPMGGM